MYFSLLFLSWLPFSLLLLSPHCTYFLFLSTSNSPLSHFYICLIFSFLLLLSDTYILQDPQYSQFQMSFYNLLLPHLLYFFPNPCSLLLVFSLCHLILFRFCLSIDTVPLVLSPWQSTPGGGTTAAHGKEPE